MTVTIKDIARAAKVSHSTVSRALSGNSGIPEETAERIKKIASSMGYVPSAVARSLKTNRSQVLGVIVSRIDDPFFSEILQGIEDVIQAEGYSLFVAASNRDDAREKTIAQTMLEHRVDGLIVGTTQFGEEHYNLLHQFGFPIVAVGNRELNEMQYTVYHDDIYGSSEVTRHLIELGHHRIGFLGNARAKRTTEGRLRGFQQEMKAAKLAVRKEDIFVTEFDQIQGGEAGAQYFMNLPERPTAIMCFNDMMAIGMMKAFRLAGVKIPQEVSVVGFDDIPFAAYTSPSLTTFEQPKYQLGYEAAKMMSRLLHAESGAVLEGSQAKMLRGKLIIRETTASPGT